MHEKIAIVGVACRLPGGIASLDDYWQVLSQGQDVVTEISHERFGTEFFQHPNRKAAGKTVTFSAGILDNIEHFDAAFFGISPREAEQMDPQQRLLLELAWEALENGGQIPENLAGSDCAVYVGIASTDYLNRRVDDPASMDAYTMTGNTASIASNRISYIFDLQGPSVSVDTACSSSLVAVHQACQAIRSGEASMAIAGGVNMLLHPFAFVGFSQASMLSARGRCRTFDASGDGYVRAEGAAVLFLKPLAQAEADGDPIHAVIVSSGINADGKTNGITVPSYNQQGKLLRKVYSAAEIDVNDLVYLEAHGTGTSIGDPIETRAIGEVLGQARRPDHPLLIGSAKSNLGHLETASGMAGLLKAVLTLEKQALPPSIHIETFNPKIDFEGLNLKVVTQLTPLKPTEGRQLVGINSFGFGGANAHVLIESYRPVLKSAVAVTASSALDPLMLSARSPAALQAMASQYATWLADDTIQYQDLAWSLAKHRAHLPQGLVLAAQSRAEAISTLQQYAEDKKHLAHLTEGRLLEKNTPLALVFSGNGSQWQGMGAVLFEHDPIFRAAIEELDQLLKPYITYSLITELQASAEQSRLYLTEIAQPLLFALQVGLVRVLQAQGIKIHATLGHSVGEVAAAWAAGALSLEQAVRVIYERSQAQAKTRGQGRMAAASLGLEKMQAKLKALGLQARVEIAGVNSPQAVTLSASLADLETLKAVFEQDKVFFRILDLDYAFHSHWMDSTQADLLAALEGLQPLNADTDIQFVSTVYGRVMAGSELKADYWWQNIRQPVAFEAGMNLLLDSGVKLFLEIGPHPILRSYMNECLSAKSVEGSVLASDQRQAETAATAKQAAYRAWLAGCSVDLAQLLPAGGRFIPLPSYPWQRERHWYPLTNEGSNLVNRQLNHPLLGYRLKEADATWENQLDTAKLPYLADHRVDGAVIIPAAAYVEMALAASAQWQQQQATHSLENFEIHAPIMLDEGASKVVRLRLQTADGSFTISSRDRLSDTPWTVNVVGRLTGSVLKDALEVAQLDQLPNTPATISAEVHYQLAEAVGLSYLEAFQGVKQVWVKGQAALAELKIPAKIEAGFAKHLLHPALLDAGFQVLVDIFQKDIQQGQFAALIPIQIAKLNLFESAARITHLQLKLKKQSPRSVLADFILWDEQGAVVAELINCRFRAVQFARTQKTEPELYEFIKVPQPLVTGLGLAPQVELQALIQVAQQALESQEANLQRQKHFTQIAPLFEVLATAFAWESMVKLFADSVEPLSIQDLEASQLIVEAQLPLLRRLLAILEEDGLAEQEQGYWQLVDQADLPAAQDIWLAILGDSPAHVPELVLLGRCGEHLIELLQGKLEPSALLQPAKSSSYEHWLASSPSFRASNLALAAMVKQLALTWPAHQRLRILELAGDHGALTDLVLPILPSAQVDYVFCDADAGKVARAQDEFAGFNGFSARVVAADFTHEQAQALVAQGQFDVILSAQALVNWGDLEQWLPRLQLLAKPQALMLLAQAQTSRFLDLTQGLQPDWWLSVDDLGGQIFVPRLHTVQEWQALLSQQSFKQIHIHFEPQDQEHAAGSFIVAAQFSHEAVPHKPKVASQKWLILASESGYSADLAHALQDTLLGYGQQVDLQTELALTQAVDHIVQLQGLGFSEVADLMALQEQRCVSTLSLVQALDQAAVKLAQLWLVTAGAMEVTQPAHAPLWGLGRVLMNEHPDLNIKLIDLQQQPSPTEAAKLLLHEYLYAEPEDEVLVSVAQRQVLRLHKTHLSLKAAPQPAAALALNFTSPGLLKHLYWRELPAQNLAVDEIEILPKAAGLNFRDVMYAMGLLSDEAVENGFAGASLGMELAGVVTRVGAAVTDFNVGDAVMGFAPACFSTRVITRTTAVAHKPSLWTDEEAATIPTTFFTVYYALQHLAQLEPGERILIHGASGGVGLAAIQYARYRGAEVFATAGTDEKRDFVRLMGADHVLDSRSLKFAEEVLRLSQGQGVDVVLNSISGEAINRNLSILRPFGRFLELGKRDFYENSKIGLRPFRNNISYFGIDADQLLIERPQLAGRLFQEMMGLFQSGVLRPLPHRVFPAQRIQDAFRYMQQSRQIGKVIVSFEGEPLRPTFPSQIATPLKLKAEASYLVTGGLSGFGLKTAAWLAEKGAKTLILLSRSGQAPADDQAALLALQAQGIRCVSYACDVADSVALAKVLTEVQTKLPPLAGVIHAAMVLDDVIVRNMSAASFRKVLAPKMLGAWNLHQLTIGLDLDFLVLYSSVTTYLGNPGQANYVAANLFLESLAHYRRAQGLAAIYAAWGPIADAGYLTRNEAVKDALQTRLGGAALTTQQALAVLEQLLQAEQTGVAVVNWDWGVLQRVMPNARSAKFSELQRAVASGDDADQAKDIHEMLAGLSPEATHALITELLLAEVGHILRLPADKLLADKSVFDLGMDSLMGMELVLAIEERFKVRLPVMALTEGATVSRIAEKIGAQLDPQTSVAAPTEQELKQQTIAAVVKKHGSAMTEAELAQLAAQLSAEEARN